MDIKETIAKVSIPLLLLSAYIIRTLYFGASFQDAAIVAVLASCYGFLKYLDTKKEVITENKFRLDVNQAIGELNSRVSGIALQLGGNPLAGQRNRR